MSIVVDLVGIVLLFESGILVYVEIRIMVVDGLKDFVGRGRNLVDGVIVLRRYKVIVFKIFFYRVDVLIIKWVI